MTVLVSNGGALSYSLSGTPLTNDRLSVNGNVNLLAGSRVWLEFYQPVHVGDFYGLVTASSISGWDSMQLQSNAHGLGFSRGFDNSGQLAGVTIDGITGTTIIDGNLSGIYYGATHLLGSVVSTDSAVLNGDLINSGEFLAQGNITNTGDILNSGTLRLDTYAQINGAGSLTQVAGTLSVDGVLGRTAVNLEGGVLNGTGTINATLNVDGGILAAGHSPGTLTINGDLNITNGAINIELGSLSDFDQILVYGNAQLGGELNIYSYGGYVPTIGDSFNFLSFAAVTGVFDSIHLYGFDSGVDVRLARYADHMQLNIIQSQPVPIPASAWLFGTALLSFLSTTRKFKSA